MQLIASILQVALLMSRVPLFSFIPGMPPQIVQKSEKEYIEERKHKDRPIKDRPNEIPSFSEMAGFLKYRIINMPRSHFSREKNVREALLKSFPFRILLEAGFKVKPFGYNISRDSEELPVASRGTSEPNTVIATDGLGNCIGVAVGGENIKNGELMPGAKTRVFHIFNFNEDPVGAVYQCICNMQDQGLTVKVGMAGGRQTERARFHANKLRAMFAAREVTVAFDRTYSSQYAEELRAEGLDEVEIHDDLSAPLASVIREDHRVQLAFELAQLIDPSDTDAVDQEDPPEDGEDHVQ